MSTSTSTVLFRIPEANNGTTTSWIPLATMHPSAQGCGATLLAAGTGPTRLAAWEPRMGLQANTSARNCLPRAQTIWWLKGRLGDDPNTAISISFASDVAKPTGDGSGACGHQAYSVGTSSVKGDGSTFLACCPIGYTYVRVGDHGVDEQCTSSLSSGQVISYSTSRNDTYTGTSSTVTSATTVVGIQINGWMFDSHAAAAGQCPSISTDVGGNGQVAGTGDVSPTTAKALLGVGIATLVIGLAIAVAGFMLFRKARREKLWAVSDDAGSQSAYSGHVQNDHDTTKAS